jgi:hypothetical protein
LVASLSIHMVRFYSFLNFGFGQLGYMSSTLRQKLWIKYSSNPGQRE